MYRQFWLETIRFTEPARFSYDWFCSAIDTVYAAKPEVVDWMDYELMARDVLNSALLSDAQKVHLLRDALSVYTLR